MAEINIFLSWSKKASRKAAEALREWLPKVLPGAKPWMSKIDITKGKPWFSSISGQLTQSPVCIIVVTPENVNSPWLHYEAGAIAHAQDDAHICTFVLGVEPGALSGTPLGQYQATTFDKDDVLLLLQAVNGALETSHDEALLRGNFDTRWPALQKKLAKIVEEMTEERPVGEAQAEAVQEAAATLSPEARHILTKAAKDSRGMVYFSKSMHGLTVTADNVQLYKGDDARTEATYRAAVNDLVSRNLMEPRGKKGESFAVTKPGFNLAGVLDTAESTQTPAASPPKYDDNDILALLTSWIGTRPEAENHKAITFSEVDKELNVPPGSAKRLLEQAAGKYDYVPDVKGENVIKFKKVRSPGSVPRISNPGWDNPGNPFRRRP